MLHYLNALHRRLSLFFVFSALLGVNISETKAVTSASDRPINYGVYDPEGLFYNSDRIAIDHIFERWTEYDTARVARSQSRAAERHRWLMITLEPWRQADESADLFNDIIAGRYDRFINHSCAHIGLLDVPIFIRWGHEMEDPTG